MLDIGPVHRREYELETGRSGKPKAGDRAERGGTVVIAQAPGRIHFLGEHCDSIGGLFLSAAIDRCVNVAVSARKDNSLRFYAADLGERKRSTLANLKYKREDRWANYVKAAIHIFAELGIPLRGMDFSIAGNIPQQIAMASSSALEVASAVALRAFLRVKISDRELVKRLSAAHTLYFGKAASPADYLVGLAAKKDQFLIVDESTLAVTKIKSPFSRCKFILMDSRVPRLGIESELENRRNDVKAALDILAQGREDASFREFAAMDIMESMGDLPEVIRRRSLHVVQEIRRIKDAGDCLACADLAGFSRLVFHSHEGLRDLYEISCPEIDWMVKRAQETEGVLGARMTGLGFGGCTYTIVRNDAVAEYRARIDDYERIFGFRPAIHELKLATGSRVIGK
ncbi:MAG: galactokinase [Treponema sp.]|nr:galactokinase [Treponema sp.]